MSVVAAERPTRVDVRALDSSLERSRARAEERHLPAMRDAYEKLIRRAARDAAASLTAQTITAASDWQPPPEGTMFNADEQAAAARAALDRSHRRVVAAVAGPPLDRAGIAWDITHPLVQELLENAGQRTGEALGEAVQFELRLALATAYTEGLAVKDAATLIREKIEDAAPWQAEMLARTDLNGLSNGSSLMTAKLVGVQTKIWLTAADERVRPEHMAANGQEVPIDQPFAVGGEQMQFPGDPAGSDGNTCNCRCTVVYEVGKRSTRTEAVQPTDALVQEAVPQFRTVAEAKTWARESGLATKSDFGRLDVTDVREALAGINTARPYVSAPLDEVGILPRGSPAAARYDVLIGEKFGDPTFQSIKFETAVAARSQAFKRAAKERLEAAKQRERQIARHTRDSEDSSLPAASRAEAREALKDAQATERWTVWADSSRPTFTMTSHEAGHWVMQENHLAGPWYQALQRHGVEKIDYLRLSEYSYSDIKEAFAEAFAARASGIAMPPKIAAALEEVLASVAK